MIYALDVSGSSCGAPLERMIGFVKARGDATKVLFFDTEVIAAIDPAQIDQYRQINGGGTIIEPVFDWVRKNAPGEKLSVLSDGMFFETAPHGVDATLYVYEHLTHLTHGERANLSTTFTKIIDM